MIDEMIGQTISHYSAFWNPASKRNPKERDKILEKLGEVPNFPASVARRVAGSLSIPPFFGGSWRRLPW